MIITHNIIQNCRINFQLLTMLYFEEEDPSLNFNVLLYIWRVKNMIGTNIDMCMECTSIRSDNRFFFYFQTVIILHGTWLPANIARQALVIFLHCYYESVLHNCLCVVFFSVFYFTFVHCNVNKASARNHSEQKGFLSCGEMFGQSGKAIMNCIKRKLR